MDADRVSRRCGGNISGRFLAIIIFAVIVIITAVYLLYPRPGPAPIPAPMPEPLPPLETVEPAQSGEERGDTARDFIAALRANPDGIEYGEAYARAREFQAAGQFADAQLLYFFAARGGYGPAAFDLATFHDPNHFSKDASLMQEPDPFQAYKWYRAALDAGNESASGRLEELRAWAEQAAGAGNAEAERLLQQWE